MLALSIMTFSIMTVSIMKFSIMTFSITIFSITTRSIAGLFATLRINSQNNSIECYYAEYRYAEVVIFYS
jgi:hypothetical protein